MTTQKGLLFVFEGVDGSGKTTQCERAIEWLLRESGREVVTFDFPGYDRGMFGKIISSFLKSEFGDPSESDPFESTILFAGDRYHEQSKINAALDRGALVVLNRYVSSNVAYSCAKLKILNRENEIGRFKEFSDELEYGCFRLPRPTATFLLNMDVEHSSRLVYAKAPREYLNGEARDAHETNMNLQHAVQSTYIDLALAEKWSIIDCVCNQQIRSIEEIEKEVKDKINQTLLRCALHQSK